MPTPLFGLASGASTGLSGISQAYLLLKQQEELRQAVRDGARDDVSLQSEFDSMQQLENFARAGLTPAQALFTTSQGAFNPLTQQAGLNNYINRTSLLSPIAAAAAAQGNPGLFNTLGSGAGVQYDPYNPTSGFEYQGAQGQVNQAQFQIRNRQSGGLLQNPAQPYGLPIAPVQYMVPQYVQQPGVQQPGVQQQSQVTAPLTTIQQQEQTIRRAVQEATRARQQQQSTGLLYPNPVSAPVRQEQTAVTFPTADTIGDVPAQADRQRDRLGPLDYSSFYSILR